MTPINFGSCRVLGSFKFVEEPNLTCVTDSHHNKYLLYY